MRAYIVDVSAPAGVRASVAYRKRSVRVDAIAAVDDGRIDDGADRGANPLGCAPHALRSFRFQR